MLKKFFVCLICCSLLLSTFFGCGSNTDTASGNDGTADLSSTENNGSYDGIMTDDDNASSKLLSSSQATESSIKNSFSNTVTFTPMTASDGNALDSNPDRGFRTELVVIIKKTREDGDDSRTVYADESDAKIRETFNMIFDIYFKKNVTPSDKLFLAYVYFTDYHEESISSGALRALDIFFTICRERKVKSMLRFCYNWSYAINYKSSLANKLKLASECANEKTILKHIGQLKPYVSKYADTIHTISCGFVGYAGEWAEAYQYPSVDYPTVIKAIVENFCVPNNLYFSIRLPEYKEMLPKDYKYRSYVSHNNDAMFGEQTKKDWESGAFQLGNSNGWWEYLTKVAAYTPQDGEMFVNSNLISTNRIPSGMEIILECAHHRHTAMSNWHGYMEALGKENVIDRWINNETVTAAELSSKNILYDPNWFVDDNYNTVKRNPYEFLKDHLGYRLVAQYLGINGDMASGSTLQIELYLKNFGFAAPFNLESGFALLDENYKPVSSVKGGTPEEWYSHAPDNSETTVALLHSASAKLKIPSKSGKYYIAFYLKNTMNDCARLSNKLDFINGYNILYSFEI